MRLVLGALFLALLLPAQWALAAGECMLDVPETAAVGEAVTFTGTVFDDGSVAYFFIGDSVIASATVPGAGLLSVMYAFGDEGHFWAQMVGVSDGEWCATPMTPITLGGATGGEAAPDESTNLVTAQILTPTTLLLSEANLPQALTLGPDDLEPALPPAARQAAIEAAATSTTTAAAATSTTTAAADTSEATAPTAPDDSSADVPTAAASVGESDGETSVVPLGVVIGLAAALLGLGGGWVVGRRRL